MTKKEFLELPAFKRASDEAEVWIQSPGIDDYIPLDAWVLPFADGRQNLIIQTKEPEDTWLCAMRAARLLNDMNLGIHFYGNLFPYLRKHGRLEGLCELGKQGRRPVWLYDTEGIADLVKKGELKYNPK
jgi:hypothetical protein